MFPSRRWLEVALGVLEWPPDQFWKSTPYELNAALAGWREKNGQDEGAAPMTSARLAELEAEYGNRG